MVLSTGFLLLISTKVSSIHSNYVEFYQKYLNLQIIINCQKLQENSDLCLWEKVRQMYRSVQVGWEDCSVYPGQLKTKILELMLKHISIQKQTLPNKDGLGFLTKDKKEQSNIKLFTEQLLILVQEPPV